MTCKLTLAEERKRSAVHKKQREAIHSTPWPPFVTDTTAEWETRMRERTFG